MAKLKGAFEHCEWCGGNGCLGCDAERRKFEERQAQPLFTARIDNPEDMDAMRRTLGAEAIKSAFGPGGGGMAEIEYNAAVESLLQALRESKSLPNAQRA